MSDKAERLEFLLPEVVALAIFKKVNKLKNEEIAARAEKVGENGKNLVSSANVGAWLRGAWNPQTPSLVAIRKFLTEQGYAHMIPDDPEPNPHYYDAETLVATPAPEDRQRALELSPEATTVEAQINGALEAAVRLLLTQGEIPAPARAYAETVLESI